MTPRPPKNFCNLTKAPPRPVVETRTECKEKLTKTIDFAKKSLQTAPQGIHTGDTVILSCLPLSALRWIITFFSPSVQLTS